MVNTFTIKDLETNLNSDLKSITDNVPSANFNPVWINNITRLNAQNLNEKMYKSIDTYVQGYGNAVFEGSNSQLKNLLGILPGYKVSDESTSEIHNIESDLSSTNEANGKYQAVFGKGNITNTSVDGQFIIGKYNNISDNFIFAIGNGTSETNRSNAFEVSNSGEVKVSNIAVTEGIVTPYVKITGTITDDTYATNKKYVDTKVEEESERAQAAEDEIRTLASSAFHFKGSKDSYDDLPKTGNTQGDVWQVGDKEYAWNGTTWVELGFNIDLSGKQDKFASVSHPGSDNTYTWLDINTPNLSIYNSNRQSVISMSNNGLYLQSIQNHVQLTIGPQNIKISKSDSISASPLLGVATPVTTADTALDITEADLPYQAVNKQYVEDNFQSKLVSGTNIKTINNQSLLGSGNIDISGGGGTITVDAELSETSTNPVQNKIITTALNSKQDNLGLKASFYGEQIIQITPLQSTYTTISLNDTVAANTGLTISPTHTSLTCNESKVGGTAFKVTNNSIAKFSSTRPNYTDPNTVNLLGVATPIASADTTLGITTADLPYQVANKAYVDAKQDKFATVTNVDSTQTVTIADTLTITTNPNLLADQIISTKALSLQGSSTSGVRLGKTVLEGSADFDATAGYLRVRDNPLANDFAVNKKYVDDSVNTKLSATTDKYSISWDDTNEGLKITFKE